MTTPKKAAPGDEPAATPAEATAGEPSTGAQKKPADELAADRPARRRRGARGGRRRHKAAEAPESEAASSAPATAVEPSDGVHRSRRRGGAVALPTAPLFPVAAPRHVAAGPARVEPPSAVRSDPARGGRPPDPSSGSKTASVAGAPVVVPQSREQDASEDETSGPKRRRRGTRGGRRRHRTAEVEGDEATREAEEAVGEPPPTSIVAAPQPATTDRPVAEEAPPVRGRRKRAEAAKPAAAGGGAAQPRRREPRRPKAIVRQDEGSGLGAPVGIEPAPRTSARVVAALPERKTILVTDDGHELRVALVEDGRLAEIYIERPERKSFLGDIYQGKVESVLNGIDAAFVDFGLEKNGFLYVDDVTASEGEKRARRISDALKNGQQVLVQVTKDPMGSKGARLSTKISLAGRYLVYVPGGSGVGVSRRLEQAERDRLRDICKELTAKDAGLIVRTIAEGHGLEDLKRDLRYLSRLWSRLKKKAETVKAPGLVHKEVDISIEVARDLFNDSCESLVVDDAKRHKALVTFLDKEAPELLPKLHRHDSEEPLFEAYGIEQQIAQALERRVSLPSGGNLVIDSAEALTVIDVNTGRFTRGKGLEDTITKTNLEAAREVVRQLRLRDIGGIIIIDFIDMAHARNREMVLETLEAELETDRTKTYVVELSPLGLVEMTRQNTTDGARGILTRACPTCLGKARVTSEETMALNVERRVRALARTSQAQAWLIEVNGGVTERLAGARLKRLEKQTGRRVFLEGGSGLAIDTFGVLAEGTTAHVQAQRVPVREGQEVAVELEFSLAYSPRDAVGYVDGYMVVVEGGRPFLGQRRKVRITATARTGAQATVLKEGSN